MSLEPDSARRVYEGSLLGLTVERWGETEREIFLTAAKWVPETDRLCFAIENQAGRQTSLPVMLHVRKAGSKVVTASK